LLTVDIALIDRDADGRTTPQEFKELIRAIRLM
jgi:hypothetical protein